MASTEKPDGKDPESDGDGMFIPYPWGPEFRKMLEETWNTARRIYMDNQIEGVGDGQD